LHRFWIDRGWLDRGRRAAPLLAVQVALAIAPALEASAHVGQGDAGSGFSAGFLHPLSGLDHLLAMLAVGMWGAQLGMPALWVLPVAFPMVMALGGVAGILGVPLPGAESAIVLSVVLLGSAIALGRRPPVWMAAALVSFFAIFHGYAHGRELPAQASALPFCAGFVLATGAIHLSGIGVGFVTKLPHGEAALRAGGAAIGLAGLLLAWQLSAG
jgi:urease accessory protein